MTHPFDVPLLVSGIHESISKASDIAEARWDFRFLSQYNESFKIQLAILTASWIVQEAHQLKCDAQLTI